MFSNRCDEFLNFYFENKTNSGLFQTMFAILDDLLFFCPPNSWSKAHVCNQKLKCSRRMKQAEMKRAELYATGYRNKPASRYLHKATSSVTQRPMSSVNYHIIPPIPLFREEIT